jgi:hypothetical protein
MVIIHPTRRKKEIPISEPEELLTSPCVDGSPETADKIEMRRP